MRPLYAHIRPSYAHIASLTNSHAGVEVSPNFCRHRICAFEDRIPECVLCPSACTCGASALYNLASTCAESRIRPASPVLSFIPICASTDLALARACLATSRAHLERVPLRSYRGAVCRENAPVNSTSPHSRSNHEMRRCHC